MTFPKTMVLTGPHTKTVKNEPVKGPPSMKKSRKVENLGTTEVVTNMGSFRNRVLIGIPTIGIVRIEWDIHRRGQTIPINWQSGEVTASHLKNSIVAKGYTTPDAQNIIANRAVVDNYEWLLLWEDDMLPPFDSLIRLSEHMEKKTVPIISGLYFSRGTPSWPLMFRGRGNACFRNWKMGDLVWCDGVGTGFLMIHCSIIQWMWHHSPRYRLPDGDVIREIFRHPRDSWYDPEKDNYFAKMGTSDLDFCDRLMDQDVLAKVGWKEVGKKRYPFLVDTNIFIQHINIDGQTFPQDAATVFGPLKE